MSVLEIIFGRNAQLIVLEHLLMNRNRISYLSGIAEATGLSHSSVTRVIEPLLKSDIVKEDAIGKQMRTFVLNMDNEWTKLLIRFFDDLEKISC
mgnify:CR=1 FL=1